MANSTTNLNLISASQSQKEVTANALFDAGSPGTLYGRNATTTGGLDWGYYGGSIMIDGVISEIANGVITLDASDTNYIEVDLDSSPGDGVPTSNTVGFTTGAIPLYTVVTGASTITSYTDHRGFVLQAGYASADQAAVSGTPTGTDAAIIDDLITLTNALRDALIKAGIIKGAA